MRPDDSQTKVKEDQEMKCVVFLAVLLAAAAAPGQNWETATAAQDWEGDLQDKTEAGSLRAMVGATWDSKYIWRGFDIYDDESATHFMVDLDLFQSCFGVSAVAHRANAGGFEDRERWDWTGYYQGGAYAGESYAVNYRFGFVYYLYPELNSGQSMDMIEAQMVLAWPKLLPIQGLQPSYALIAMGQASNDSVLADGGSGVIQIGMLDYGFSIPGITPVIPELVVTLHAEVVYNDGVTITPARLQNDWTIVHPNPDHGFSHAVFGASTDVPLGKGGNLLLTPSVYYQNTMTDSINEDDSEFWASVGLKYVF
jgi:hypothetical protein